MFEVVIAWASWITCDMVGHVGLPGAQSSIRFSQFSPFVDTWLGYLNGIGVAFYRRLDGRIRFVQGT